jgi:hypothetical protein
MEFRRWYRGTAEPKIENGQNRIRQLSDKLSTFIKGDAPIALKVAAVGAGLILLPLFLMMTFLVLSSAFFAMMALRTKRRRGLFYSNRSRRPARMW